MVNADATRLLLRQLKDIQAQAEKIADGGNSEDNIESFARYSVELKDYIRKNIQSKEIVHYLSEVPDVEYERIHVKLWQYLIMPSWWITLYKDYVSRQKAVEQINTIRGKFATIEILVRSESV
jgi:hypothetical protein